MDIPDFRRGEQLTARKLNQLGNEIRLARLLSGPGYTLTQTPGGTVLNIPQQVSLNIGGASECRWKLSQTGPMKIKIANAALNGQYPDGMSKDGVYELDVPDTQDWHAIYLVMVVDDTGNVDSSPTGLTFAVEGNYKKNDGLTRYFLVGEVVSTDQGGEKGREISYIHSECPFPFPAAGGGGGAGGCFFRISDASEPGESGALTIKIEIAFGLVQNRVPFGMVAGTPYVIDGEQESNFYVWCVMVYDEKTLELKPENTAISFEVSTDLKTNTTDTQYHLVGVVEIDPTGGPNHGPFIKKITQNCAEINPNPCALAWSTPS